MWNKLRIFSLPLVLYELEVCASRDSILGKVMSIRRGKALPSSFPRWWAGKKMGKQDRKSFVRHHQRTEVWRLEGDYDRIGHARGFWGAGYNLFQNLNVV